MNIREESRPGMGCMKVTEENREREQRMLHAKHLWQYWSIVILGIWMIAVPLTSRYQFNPVEPAG